nr:hypothetical protein [Deltaproteobacteria bacterium]
MAFCRSIWSRTPRSAPLVPPRSRSPRAHCPRPVSLRESALPSRAFHAFATRSSMLLRRAVSSSASLAFSSSSAMRSSMSFSIIGCFFTRDTTAGVSSRISSGTRDRCLRRCLCTQST